MLQAGMRMYVRIVIMLPASYRLCFPKPTRLVVLGCVAGPHWHAVLHIYVNIVPARGRGLPCTTVPLR